MADLSYSHLKTSADPASAPIGEKMYKIYCDSSPLGDLFDFTNLEDALLVAELLNNARTEKILDWKYKGIFRVQVEYAS